MSTPHVIEASEGAQFNTYTRADNPLGTRMRLADGRVFRFALMGTVAGAAGKLYQSEVPANQTGLAVATHAISVTRLTVTFGAAVTADQYKEGYLWCDQGAGNVGFPYQIKSHPAGTSDVPVDLWTPTQTTIAASTTVSAIQNPFYKVVLAVASPTAMVVGVDPVGIPASNYGWLQTHGPCSVLTEGTVVIGKMAMPSTSATGGVAPWTAGGEDEVVVGQVMEVEATTQYSLFFLTLEGS